MILQQIIDDPTQSFSHCERYVHKTDYPMVSAIGEVRTAYTSYAGEIAIKIPVLWVESDILSTHVSNHNNTKITDRFLQDDLIGIPVHPQVLEDRMCPAIEFLANQTEKITWISAIPTASWRTFLTLDEEKFFIKTHFPGRIGVHFRPLTRDKVNRSRWVSDQLGQLVDQPGFNSLGVFIDMLSLSSDYGRTCAATIRSYQPFPSLDREPILLPLCSLSALDLHAPHDPPLILQLADHHGMPADDYLLEMIVKPHLRLWGNLAYNAGLILEMHGQNTVLLLDKNTNILRFCVRDLGNSLVWQDRRKQLGLAMPDELFAIENPKGIRDELSLTYDVQIADILIAPLVRAVAKRGFSEKILRLRIAEVLNQLHPWTKDYLQPNAIKFIGTLDNIKKVNTNLSPSFRK